jgi:hypothetical protein
LRAAINFNDGQIDFVFNNLELKGRATREAKPERVVAPIYRCDALPDIRRDILAPLRAIGAALGILDRLVGSVEPWLARKSVAYLDGLHQFKGASAALILASRGRTGAVVAQAAVIDAQEP